MITDEDIDDMMRTPVYFRYHGGQPPDPTCSECDEPLDEEGVCQACEDG